MLDNFPFNNFIFLLLLPKEYAAAATAAAAAAAKSLQSCPTLCDPIDGSPPGSSVPGILQERTLEWVAISFSKEYANNNKKCRLSASNWHILPYYLFSQRCEALIKFTNCATRCQVNNENIFLKGWFFLIWHWIFHFQCFHALQCSMQHYNSQDMETT